MTARTRSVWEGEFMSLFVILFTGEPPTSAGGPLPQPGRAPTTAGGPYLSWGAPLTSAGEGSWFLCRRLYASYTGGLFCLIIILYILYEFPGANLDEGANKFNKIGTIGKMFPLGFSFSNFVWATLLKCIMIIGYAGERYPLVVMQKYFLVENVRWEWRSI